MRTTICAPLLLALSLAACGDEGATTAPPRDATPPVLEILAPAPADSVFFAGPVLVRARCREDDGRGCSVAVYLGVTLVAFGTDSVSTVVSLPPNAAQPLRLVLEATNLSGGRTTAQGGELRLPSTHWVPVVTTPDFLVDASLERALHLDDGSDLMSLLDLRTGEDRQLARQSTWTNVRGPHVVTAAGAIIDFGPPFETKPTGIREFGGSNARDDRAYGPIARGRWAAWYHSISFDHPSFVVYRDDVLGASLTHTPDSIEANGAYDLAENGTVAFTGHPLDGEDDPESRLYLWNGAETRLLTPDPAVHASGPLTDGTGVVYTRGAPDAGGMAYRLVHWTPGGEEVLTALSGPTEQPASQSRRGSAYLINNGWVAYRVPQGSGPGTLWIRTPSGERRQVWPDAPPSGLGLVSLGPAGEVVARDLATSVLYLVHPTHARGRAIDSGERSFFKWIDGVLYGFTARTMYRLERAGP